MRRRAARDGFRDQPLLPLTVSRRSRDNVREGHSWHVFHKSGGRPVFHKPGGRPQKTVTVGFVAGRVVSRERRAAAPVRISCRSYPNERN